MTTSLQSSQLAPLSQLMSELKTLNNRKIEIVQEAQTFLDQLTLTEEDIRTVGKELSASGAQYYGESESWLPAFHKLQVEAYSAIESLYPMYDPIIVEVDIEVEGLFEPEQISVAIPFSVYAPHRPGLPKHYLGDKYLPILDGVQITPEMITAVRFKIEEESNIDDDGNAYLYHVLKDFDIKLDTELLEMALHQYVAPQLNVENVTQINFDLAEITLRINEELTDLLREAESFPYYSQHHRISLLWAFLHLPEYSRRIVSEYQTLAKEPTPPQSP